MTGKVESLALVLAVALALVLGIAAALQPPAAIAGAPAPTDSLQSSNSDPAPELDLEELWGSEGFPRRVSRESRVDFEAQQLDGGPLRPSATGQITGVITAADTGLPLSGVDIDLNKANGVYVDYAYTAADGSYAFTGLADGCYSLWIYGPGLYMDQGSPSTIAVVGGAVTRNINVALPLGARVTGRVTSSLTGGGLGGVYVELERNDGYVYGYASTSASGYYTTTAVPTGSYRVRFGDPWDSLPYLITWYHSKPNAAAADWVSVVAPDITTGIDQELAFSSARISGRVTAADTGQPLGHASFVVYDANGKRASYGVADSSGTYSSRALPAGRYRIQFSDPPPYTWQFFNGKPTMGAADEVVVETGPVNDINGVLPHGGTFTGTVTAADTGLPLADVVVAAYDDHGGRTYMGRTRADGSYGGKPLLPAGQYRVYFEGLRTYDPQAGAVACTPGKRYRAEYYADAPDLVSSTLVTVLADATVPDIDASLEVDTLEKRAYLPMVIRY